MNSEDNILETKLSAATEVPEEFGQTSITAPVPITEAETVVQLQDKAEPGEKQPQTIQSTSPKADDLSYVALIFRDGLDLPIPGLELFVTLPSGAMCTAISTAQGAITLPVPANTSGQAKVEVKDGTGKRQPVCSIELEKCKDAVIIRSPKVKAALPLRPHQQTPPPAINATTSKSAIKNKPSLATEPAKVDTGLAWWSANGAWGHAKTWLTSKLHLNEQAPESVPKTPVISSTLSNAGQPVTVIVGPECPNKDNLRLGRNNIYRQAILDAAKRLGLIPQALCALMDCEAGKITEYIPKLGPDGKQLKDKKGKTLTTPIRELWNANAGNTESGAAGLTQFLATTWLSHAMTPGRYLHTQCQANGWVRKKSNAKGSSHWVFMLMDGTTTDNPHSMRKIDSNVRKCLAMRMDPIWSINAAADYGNANLRILTDKRFKLTGLNDMDKAKLMYLMHHEGEGAGPLFIRNKLASAKDGIPGLRKKFAKQLGKDGAALAKGHIDDASGDVELAYRTWLATYVDKMFAQSGKYFCSQPIPIKKTTELLPIIGGEKIHESL
jgi:hypothetical protein